MKINKKDVLFFTRCIKNNMNSIFTLIIIIFWVMSVCAIWQ